MTFLNPFMLFGLVAASVPLVIHLLNLRKLRTVDFSSLRFLKELQRSSIRRVKIRQWLLLAIRTLLIVTLVFAFARPALHGTFAGFLGGRASTAMLLLIDDSPSTSARNDRGEIFPQIRAAAQGIAGLLREGDQLFVLRMSEIGRREEVPSVRNPDDLRALLASAAPTQIRGSYLQALAKGGSVLAGTSTANRELYLLTDAQANQFAPTLSQGKTEPSLAGVHVFVVSPAPAQGVNGEVASTELVTRVLTKSRPVELQASIRVPGDRGSLSSVASVYLGGSRVAQQSVDVAAGESATLHARFVPRQTGMLSGYVQMEDDALDFDNRRFYTMTVPQRLNVLLCGHAPSDLRYVRLALSLGGDSTFAGLFAVQNSTEHDLASLDYGAFDVLCLADVPSFSTASAEAVSRFVRSGGGLMIFMGDDVDLSNYNATLFSHLGLPPASAPPRSAPPAGDHSQELSIRRVDLDHPVFEGMFEDARGTRRGNVETPAVFRSAGINVGTAGHAIMVLSNQLPFLAEFPAGEGKVLVFTVDAAGSWSAFPTSALFAPLMYRSMNYLGNASASLPPATVGTPVEVHLRLRNQDARSTFAFFSPSGLAEKVVPVFSPVTGAATFRSGPTQETGIERLYRLAPGLPLNGQLPPGEPLAQVAVNADTAESDLRQADKQKLEAYFAHEGIPQEDLHLLSAADSPSSIIQQSRYGVELWRFFIAAAFLLGIVELALGNALRRVEEQRDLRPG